MTAACLSHPPYLEQLVLTNKLGPGLKFQSGNLAQVSRYTCRREKRMR